MLAYFPIVEKNNYFLKTTYHLQSRMEWIKTNLLTSK
jgi:hypothetical protein